MHVWGRGCVTCGVCMCVGKRVCDLWSVHVCGEEGV